MLRIFLCIFLLLILSAPAHAVDPDEFIGLEFREDGSTAGDASAVSGTAGDHRPGEVWTEPTTGMQFIWIPAGCFMMGSNDGSEDEKPLHKVCVDGFWMGRYEVTNAQYKLFKPRHNSREMGGPSLPVAFVAWEEAVDYAKWLSTKGNGVFRLPTEAEWEYAARAGSEGSTYWAQSGNLCEHANVLGINSAGATYGYYYERFLKCDDAYPTLAPVGSFKPNGFGLYDMLGNVREFCRDSYDAAAYSRHAEKNPEITDNGYMKVIRGGGWDSLSLMVSGRMKWAAGNGYQSIGFRLVRVE